VWGETEEGVPGAGWGWVLGRGVDQTQNG